MQSDSVALNRLCAISRPGTEDDRVRSWLAGGDIEVGHTPSSSSSSIPPAANAHLLQARELLVLMNRGNRKIGMAVVKDTIAMIRAGLAGPMLMSSCLPGDKVDTEDVAGAGHNPQTGDKYIPDLGIYVLQAIADVMKREQEASGLSHTATASPSVTLPDPRVGGSDASGGSGSGSGSGATPGGSAQAQSNNDPTLNV